MLLAPESLVLFAGATLVLNLTPGPDLLYTMSRAGGQGVRSGVAAATGNFLGTLVQTACVVLGLAAVLAASAAAFEIVRWLGVAYLVYLGLRAFRNGTAGETARPRRPATFRRVLAEAFVIHTLNPKVVLFFLAFLPQFVSAPTPGGPDYAPAWVQLAALGLWFAAQTFVTLCVLSALAHRVGEGVRSRPALVTFARRATGTLFLALGARLALQSQA
ncbi:MAG: LysE family translocator [Phycisphaerales bacterium JB040]